MDVSYEVGEFSIILSEGAKKHLAFDAGKGATCCESFAGDRIKEGEGRRGREICSSFVERSAD